ncbi:beta-lactamase/transpeptidase-like protein [Phlebopus sp. FC_14]|nr:beta-lactamase/transpeptidase-like protein [Phlebopus sp. FC_14]
MKRPDHIPAAPRQRQHASEIQKWSLFFNLVLALTALYLYRLRSLPTASLGSQVNRPNYHPCDAPLPPLLRGNPPTGDHPVLKHAFQRLDAALHRQFELGSIDSLSVAVVSSGGPVFEWFRGPLRANETHDEKRGAVDRNSVYRLASLSKLATTVETLILRDRGVLSLDDSIAEVFPALHADAAGVPITYRQLLSHMSGLGRDLPPGDAAGKWPESLGGGGPPPMNGLPFPTLDAILKAVIDTPRVVGPYSYPVYSNTGYQLLGMANVAANQKHEGNSAPSTHAELVHRDIFGPLGMNGTSFLVTEANRDQVAISSFVPFEVDQDFKDASNPSGGQLSSLADLVKLTRVLIDPTVPESPLSPHTVREWMRPLHTWFDGFSAVGMLWEIESIQDVSGRKLDVYQKTGELGGHHSNLAINPATSYGVIVLTTGPISRVDPLTKLVLEHVQPAFDIILQALVNSQLIGRWVSDDSRASMSIEMQHGSLYATEYVVDGSDVLAVMQGTDNPSKVAIWFTGDDEFRLAVAADYDGCSFSWVALDAYGYIDGVSVNTIRILDDAERVLFLPSMGIQLRRL